ncbi:MAG: hypothetical protein K2X66_17110 [Cyanobacteria bacterium]|nr:hypothetical protein [Cyanobacteriota bacterium]
MRKRPLILMLLYLDCLVFGVMAIIFAVVYHPEWITELQRNGFNVSENNFNKQHEPHKGNSVHQHRPLSPKQNIMIEPQAIQTSLKDSLGKKSPENFQDTSKGSESEIQGPEASLIKDLEEKEQFKKSANEVVGSYGKVKKIDSPSQESWTTSSH